MVTSRNDIPAGWRAVDVESQESPTAPARLKRWSLLLSAVGIEHRCDPIADGQRLLVREQDWRHAQDQIRNFELENRGWPPRPLPALRHGGSLLVTLSVVFLLASFHNLTRSDVPLPWLDAPDWLQLGDLYAGKVRNGELWRLVTSLTLHADTLHLAGNALATTLFIEHLRKHYGSGSAWGLFLLCGVAGNLLNALLQPYHHQAVGASTAVFGLLGAIASDSFLRHRALLWRRWALPFAAAAALLGLLGTAGENTDLGAHLWGFFSGLLLGFLFARRYAPTRRPRPWANRALALLCVLTVAACWGAALMFST